MSGESLFVGEPELAVSGAHGEDERAGVVECSRAVHDGFDGVVGVDAGDVVGDELCAEFGGLEAHVGHEVGAHDALGEPGIVFDLGGSHESATSGDAAFEHEGLELGAGGVEGCRVSGGAAADDDEIVDGGGHGCLAFCGLSGLVILSGAIPGRVSAKTLYKAQPPYPHS